MTDNRAEALYNLIVAIIVISAFIFLNVYSREIFMHFNHDYVVEIIREVIKSQALQ